MHSIRLIGVSLILGAAALTPVVARAHPAAAMFSSHACPYTMTVPAGWTVTAGKNSNQSDSFSRNKFVQVKVTCTPANGHSLTHFVQSLVSGYKKAGYTVTAARTSKNAGRIEFHTSGGLYAMDTLGNFKGQLTQFLYLAVLQSNYKAYLNTYLAMLKSVNVK